jgi:hypothetical protein
MKAHEIDYNTAQHNVFSLGRKHLILVVGYTDGCYSQFNDYDIEGNKQRTTEDLVLNDPDARYDSPNRWIRYKFRRICRLPFKVAYRWAGDDEIFKIYPTLWIRTKKIQKDY